MKKYTPGPWDAGELPVRSECHGNLPTVYIWDEGEINFIATVCDEDNDGRYTRANADLIAAAPELLEALSRILAIRVRMQGTTSDEHSAAIMAWEDQAKAAIAKAKGGA